MRKLITWLCVAFASCSLSAQSLSPEVVASAGETFYNNEIYLDWTLGEIMTETFVDGIIVLTQGFHQANDQATSIEDQTIRFADVKVYPNPTSGSLSIEREGSGKLDLTLWDMKGSIVLQKSLDTSFGNLDISMLPQGMYVLQMSDGKFAPRSIRIKKL